MIDTSIAELPCSKCKSTKPLEEFRRRPSRPVSGKRQGRWSWCMVCELESAKTPRLRKFARDRKRRFLKKLKEDNPEEYKRRNRVQSLKRLYGISEEEFNCLLNKQGGVCAICNDTPKEASHRWRYLFVDHDHETGDVRGILCGVCNFALGGFKDSPELLRKAIVYLLKQKNTGTFTTTAIAQPVS